MQFSVPPPSLPISKGKIDNDLTVSRFRTLSHQNARRVFYINAMYLPMCLHARSIARTARPLVVTFATLVRSAGAVLLVRLLAYELMVECKYVSKINTLISFYPLSIVHRLHFVHLVTRLAGAVSHVDSTVALAVASLSLRHHAVIQKLLKSGC